MSKKKRERKAAKYATFADGFEAKVAERQAKIDRHEKVAKITRHESKAERRAREALERNKRMIEASGPTGIPSGRPDDYRRKSGPKSMGSPGR
jgi:hypothetical protein